MIVDDDVPSPSTSTSRSTPRSARVSIGSSGSVTARPRPRALGGRTASSSSPLAPRVGPGDDLHLGEHPAERLGVQPVATGPAEHAGRRATSGRSTPLAAKTWSSTASTSSRPSPGRRRRRRGGGGLDRVGGEQLGAQRPERVERGEQPAARLVGAPGQRDEPAAGVVAVVGELLDALRRDRGQHRVAAGAPAARSSASRAGRRTAAAARPCRRSRRWRPRRAARCGTRAASRKNASASSGGTGEPSGSAGTTRRVGRGGPGQQQPRLAEQVERDVGQRDVVLEVGRVAAPLREPVRHDQRVVAEHQAVRRQRRRVDAVGDVVSTPASGSSKSVPKAQCGRRRRAGRRRRCRASSSGSGVVACHQRLTCGGRRRGCRRTSGAGRPCRRSGANSGSFSSGLDAVIASARTTQMLTPSLRRV